MDLLNFSGKALLFVGFSWIACRDPSIITQSHSLILLLIVTMHCVFVSSFVVFE